MVTTSQNIQRHGLWSSSLSSAAPAVSMAQSKKPPQKVKDKITAEPIHKIAIIHSLRSAFSREKAYGNVSFALLIPS
jgi:hypothetical protein